jgi:hypothetical protein
MKKTFCSIYVRRTLLLALLLVLGDVRGLANKAKTKRSSGKGFGASKEPTLLHTPDTSPSTQKLVEFLKANNAKGVAGGAVEVGVYNGRRGLFATKNIKKDETVFMIPSDCALALSDPADPTEKTQADDGLGFLNMYWNNPKNRQMWAPYLDTLPTKELNFDPTPDYLSDDEIELLEFPRLINRIRNRKKKIETLASENGIDYDELQFSTWLVSSRAFNIEIAAPADSEVKYDERGQVIAKAKKVSQSVRVLVPFMDLVNHESISPNCRMNIIDPDRDESWFALEATRPIPAGRELLITYGGGILSSVELFSDYGFIPDQNKVDAIMLRKGGDGCITSADGWTTTLEEDQNMITMIEEESDNSLKKILDFRIKLKKAYSAM